MFTCDYCDKDFEGKGLGSHDSEFGKYCESCEDEFVLPLQRGQDYWLQRAEVGFGIALQGHSSAEVNQRLNSVGY